MTFILGRAQIYAPVIWGSFDNIPEDKLVKMATYTSQQVWVFPEGQTELSENNHAAINAPLVLGQQATAISHTSAIMTS